MNIESSFSRRLQSPRASSGNPFRNIVAILAILLTWGVCVPATQAAQQDIPAPPASSAAYARIFPLPNGNIVVVDRNYSIPGGATEVGAVYLLKGSDLSVISVLTGTTTNDAVGLGIIVLPGGNYLVTSQLWNNNRGAVTWCDANVGLNGTVSAANSLVGNGTTDNFGMQVIPLANGNFVACARTYVTWGSGSTASVGSALAHPTLTGLPFNPFGKMEVVPLTNGNYVVVCPNYDNDRGAVAWGNGTTGTSGIVGASNTSLTGNSNGDLIGAQTGKITVFPLANGHYVVCSRNWSRSGAFLTGAVTWCNGTMPTTGQVHTSNSLIGNFDHDHIGDAGVIVLANGNYVVCSPDWDNGATSNVGAATWCDGSGPTVGNVTAMNSLYGSSPGDSVAIDGGAALTNGHYVIASSRWNAGRGAATWCNGTAPTSGAVSAINSIVGSAGDFVGSGFIFALTNGNYVVCSPNWQNGPLANAGAATWGNGSLSTTAVVSSANSLVGSTAEDKVGEGGVTALVNGHYVVRSPSWDRGTLLNAGAATWANGNGGTVGIISEVNSLVGRNNEDQVSDAGVVTLSNGHYVVLSSKWDSSPLVTDAGAVTWGNGTTGISGEATSTNSLVGNTTGDAVGLGLVAPLASGDYLVHSVLWDNETIADAGVVTYGFGANGSTTGLVTAANSVRGTAPSDVFHFAFDPVGNRTFVGRGGSKLLSIFTVTPPNTPPTDIGLSNSSIAENNVAGAAIGNLTATDADAGQTHTFALVAGIGDNDNAAFSITGNVLSIVGVADFETKNSYSIRVRATDNGDPAASVEKSFAITITDVSENVAPTDISLNNTSITENNILGAIVGNLSATDPDAGQSHTFTLVAGPGSTDNSAFSIVNNILQIFGSADFETKASYAIRVRATDNGNPVASFEKQFVITVVDVLEGPVALSDAATTGTGPSVVYPLANDLNPNDTIVSVSNPAITISADGRSLIIPPDFTGSFTYTTEGESSATITVTAGTPLPATNSFNGLLRDETGAIAGWARASFSAKGFVTTQLLIGSASARKKLLIDEGNNTGSSPTPLGTLTITRNSDGTVACSLAATSGTFAGTLRPTLTSLPAEKLHVALASIDLSIPGGGYLIATIKAKGSVVITGLLPDGRSFSAGTGVSDNGTIAFHAKESKVKPAGVVSGELVKADLAATDVTGEAVWIKPLQSPGVKGVHLGGVDTILTANGSIYNRVIPLSGNGTLKLRGGNLAADESNAVTVTAGKPTVPTGSLTAWAGAKPATGKFTAKVQVPDLARPVKGAGIYLPKSNTAWGYFPGTVVGGRIELTVP